MSKIRLIISKILGAAKHSSDLQIEVMLGELKASQLEILKALLELKKDDVPRNANRIYKISRGRNILFLNELLPQVYLTLVSVLEGVVLAVLVDEFSFDFWGNTPIIYAYFVASLLIIVAFWFSYLSAIFDGRWPFHIIDTFLFFSAATAQAVAVRYVSEPARWCQAILVMCILVALIYLRQIPLLRELRDLDLFEDPEEARKRLFSVTILVVFFLVIATVAFLYLPIITSNPQDPVAAVLVIAFPAAYMLYSIYNTKRMGIDDIG
jgi:hypothetical protein